MGNIQSLVVVPISNEYSAVICRLPRGQSVHGVQSGSAELALDGKFRIFSQDRVIWVVIVARRRLSGEGTLQVAWEDGRVSPTPVVFVEASWSAELEQVLVQLVRHIGRRKRKLPHDGLRRFLSLNSAWGERSAATFSLPGHLVVAVPAPDLGTGVRETAVIAFNENEVSAFDVPHVVTSGGTLLLTVPEGDWRSLFLTVNGQCAQIDLRRGTHPGWSAFEIWLSQLTPAERGELADYWAWSDRRPPSGVYQALHLPVSAALSLPNCHLRFVAAFSAGRDVLVFGEAPEMLPSALSFTVQRPGGDIVRPGRQMHVHPMPSGGYRFVLVARVDQTGPEEAFGGELRVLAACGDHASHVWLRPAPLDDDAFWRMVDGWRPPGLCDDAYLRDVVLPLRRRRWHSVPLSVLSFGIPSAARADGADTLSGEALVVSTADVTPLAETTLALYLLAGKRIRSLRILLTEPEAADGLRDQVRLWSECYGMNIALVVPHRPAAPFAVLRACLAAYPPTCPILVFEAGVLPLSADIAGTIADGAGHDLAIAPGSLDGEIAGAATGWRLSSAACNVLAAMTLPAASMEIGLKGLILALREHRMTWGEDRALSALKVARADNGAELHLDNLLISEVGWTHDRGEFAKSTAPLTSVRPKKGKVFATSAASDYLVTTAVPSLREKRR